MKFKKKYLDKASVESQQALKEADDVKEIADLTIEPDSESIYEIADTVQDSIETFTSGEYTIPDQAAQSMAKEIKTVANKIGADAVVLPPQDKMKSLDFIRAENQITMTLNRILKKAKLFAGSAVPMSLRANVLITGDPGGGKTAIVNGWIEDNHLVKVELNAAAGNLREVLSGIPVPDKDANVSVRQFEHDPLDPLRNKKNRHKCILYIDEFNRADPMNQRALMSLINEKHLVLNKSETSQMMTDETGETYNRNDFSDTLLFTIASINPANKNDITAQRLPGAVLSRFSGASLNYAPTAEETLAYLNVDLVKYLVQLGLDVPDFLLTVDSVDETTGKNINFISVDKNKIPKAVATFGDLSEIDKEILIDKIKAWHLGKYILTHELFGYNSSEDKNASTRHLTQRTPLNSRMLTDSLLAYGDDVDTYKSWVANLSGFDDDTKKDLITILDSYTLDEDSVLKSFGIDKNELPNAAEEKTSKEELEDNDGKLFATGKNTVKVADSKETINRINNTISQFNFNTAK